MALAPAQRIVAVDTHQGDNHTGPADTLAEFLMTLRLFEVADRVTLILGRFEDIEPFLALRSFDMAFVDGQHDIESTIFQTQLAQRCVKDRGIIAWHDYTYTTVRAAVKACGLCPGDMVDSLAWQRV